MLRSSAFALLVAGLAPAAAHAEFVLRATPSSREAAAFGPAVSGEPVPQARPERHVHVASGFGKDVPLRFAARQLLPPGWRVHYGRGVDPDRSVTWRGGRAWNRVLMDAVRPAGLRATFAPDGGRVVLIER